ncbi:hypothetical protein [Pseudonocardia humida]|uniref:DUF3099 family protein n=1 Tax=Pseudonocardia humida TaxID=2800819 RepID=A0ABT0ZV96_9PSEU|nr:hypothetical protein [Pseudonocardia humida]MCO1654668.1 hypothetical protein [Pseudonocardia humida]
MDHTGTGGQGAASGRSRTDAPGAHARGDRALAGDIRMGVGEALALLVGLVVVSGWVAAMRVAGFVVLFGWLIWHPDVAIEEGRRA